MKRPTWMILASMMASCASTAPVLPSSSAVGASSPPDSPITGVLQQPSIKGNEHFVWCASCPGLTMKIADTSDYSSSKEHQHFQSPSSGLKTKPSTPEAMIFFEPESSSIHPELTLQLLALARDARDGDTVEIKGFTDSSGNKPYNQRLAEKRADAVHRWMLLHIKHHVTYKISAYGKCCYAHQPGLSPENRRVEVRLIKRRRLND